LNKSYQNLNNKAVYQDQKVGIPTHNNTMLNNGLNTSQHSKTMKKNLSFLSSSNHNGELNITYIS